MKPREVMWTPVRGPGFEHCRVTGRVADGMVIGIRGDQPFRTRYAVEWDERWRTRSLHVDLLDAAKSVVLLADGEGNWRTAEGRAIAALDGCIDVDLSVTPFTNTLPVRRLDLAPLASQELSVAYVDVPDLRVGISRQRYTCLVRRDDGTMHRFESGTFRSDIVLDADGLVVEYPHGFTRVWPR
ncbi:MAG: transcriptional regulator [Chloroflexi bacterium]|nr:MAG: transcriptional regulator [Chloroflexota bacterium]